VEYDKNLSAESDTGFIGSLASAAGLTSSTLLDRAARETLDDVVFKSAPDTSTAKQIRDALGELHRTGFVDLRNVGGHHIRVAHLSVDQLQGMTNVPFRSFTDIINGTSTYFNIDIQRAAFLYTAAELLIRNRFEDHFRAILAEMAANAGK
jgi:hypothetical protein